jgi:hypothetical protein
MSHRLCPAAAVLALAACSGDDPPPPPAPMNSAPQFTSPAAVNAPESSAGTVYTATASDADGDAVSFSISGGADAARFAIVGASGALSFVAAPDFEIPSDANGDNVYLVTLAASDGRGGVATLALQATVTDVAEPFVVRRRGTGFNQPLFVAGAGDGSGRLFVAEKGGRIRILNPATGAVNATPFLDVSAQISTTSERGLLGLAFAPDYAASGVFYVYLSAAAGPTEIRRYQVSANPDVANAASGDVILRIPHAGTNHRGGWIGFGTGGLLHIASGDDSFGVSLANPAPDPNSLIGKILRIDVSGDDFPADADRDYRIPAGNPFAAGGGLPEVFALGLRNPFRASVDPATGRLFIGDVGEGAREEINLVPANQGGLNFGWPRLEGTQVILPAAVIANPVPPSVEYLHGAGPFEGNSVTGGVVNRGPVAALQGQYIFGDFVSENIWTVPAAAIASGTTLTSTAMTRRTDEFLPDAGTIDLIASFGTDDAGNVYIVDLGGEIFRLETP